MMNLNKQTTVAMGHDQAASLLFAICPYQNRNRFLQQNYVLIPSENGTGWFFECRLCQGARCTGFLRDD